MTSQALTLQQDVLTLHANLYGKPEHPLVILVHGFPDTPHCWDQVYPILVKSGYQVLVPWLRGYTANSVSRKAHYGLTSASSDLNAWLDLLKANKRLGNQDKVHLVGHDWGAAIAMTYASQHAKVLHSVSLLAVPPIPGFANIVKALPNFPRQLYMSSYMLLMQSALAERVLSRNSASFVEKVWRKWSPTWQFNESDFAPTRMAFSNPNIAWAATRYYRNLFAIHRRDNWNANKKMLTPITVPTLALAGMDDGCMNIQLHQVLAQPDHFPQSLCSIHLPNCGHFLQAEQPQRVAELLLEHFQQTTV